MLGCVIPGLLSRRALIVETKLHVILDPHLTRSSLNATLPPLLASPAHPRLPSWWGQSYIHPLLLLWACWSCCMKTLSQPTPGVLKPHWHISFSVVLLLCQYLCPSTQHILYLSVSHLWPASPPSVLLAPNPSFCCCPIKDHPHPLTCGGFARECSIVSAILWMPLRPASFQQFSTNSPSPLASPPGICSKSWLALLWRGSQSEATGQAALTTPTLSLSFPVLILAYLTVGFFFFF